MFLVVCACGSRIREFVLWIVVDQETKPNYGKIADKGYFELQSDMFGSNRCNSCQDAHALAREFRQRNLIFF